MNPQSRIGRPILHFEIEGFDKLIELALDMRWSWNHATDELWRRLDPELWNLTRNPWVVLQTVSHERIEHVLPDPAFQKQLADLLQTRRTMVETPAWFQQQHAQAPLSSVAYFSMEFMLNEALPIYSGGLGNVAGDQLKAASDLGVPVAGVGLLYQQGYFRQVIDALGAQQALYPYNDPGQLPIAPLRRTNGEWLRLQIALPGGLVWLRAWQVQVGRVRLYLLDSNDATNLPVHRAITSELYGGDPELRLQQEMLLGIGGWRLLSALGIQPEVCHLNEGHAAFAVLERAREFMEANSQPFDVALAATRAGNLFTTHTAVAAGFDRFTPALLEPYLRNYAEQQLGISFGDLLALGRQNADDAAEPFNMAYLAIRGSASVNGVSRLHGQVSRQLFAPLFPRWPLDDVPISHVTNGVHTPTWDSAAADELWTRACGKDRWLGTMQTLDSDIRCVADADLWQLRNVARGALVGFVRARLVKQMTAAGASAEAIDQASRVFDPQALTLGFARRFATYKRPNLLLHDSARLLRLLASTERPVQLLIAGKAHPDDHAGQDLIRQWIRFIRRPECRAHVVFLSDYDMHLTEQLVAGVDVWINTPRRPWEACGTSGMKVLVNGGLNLSERDGWWAEAYCPEVGWALGDGLEHDGDPANDAAQDASEAEALYEILEREVIPEFHARNHSGLPEAWLQRIRESMARLTPQFSANRAVRDYTNQHYLPAAAAYRARAADRGARAKSLVAWQQVLDRHWDALRFGGFKVERRGAQYRFEVEVDLDGLDPQALRVELYAEGRDGGRPARHLMIGPEAATGATGARIYRAEVAADRRAEDYTARLIPHREALAIPLEQRRILWQR